MVRRAELQAYKQHKINAEKRGIDFLLSFEEWLQLWEESGHLAERGCRSGQYCMARQGDKGPYAVGNVRICSVTENHMEYEHAPEVRAVLSEKSKGNKSFLGKTHTDEFRTALSRRNRGNTYTKGKKRCPEVVARISEANTGKKRSAQARANISAAMKIAARRRWDRQLDKEKP